MNEKAHLKDNPQRKVKSRRVPIKLAIETFPPPMVSNSVVVTR